MLNKLQIKTQVNPNQTGPVVNHQKANKNTLQNLLLPQTFINQTDKLTVTNLSSPKAFTTFNFADTSHDSAPVQKLKNLGRKYGIPFKGSDSSNLEKYQEKVIKAIITTKAKEKKLPVNIALGIAGHESHWQMWDGIGKLNPTIVAGRNIVTKNKKRVVVSTDWGVMQINDKAHPQAFPGVKNDLETNIDFGLRLLSGIRTEAKGNLGYGLGDWDGTVAAYNLGHKPQNSRERIKAKSYVKTVINRSKT